MEMDQKQVQELGRRLMGILSSSHSLFSPSYPQLPTLYAQNTDLFR